MKNTWGIKDLASKRGVDLSQKGAAEKLYRQLADEKKITDKLNAKYGRK